MAKHRTGSPTPREGEQEIFEEYKGWVKNVAFGFRKNLPPGLDWDDVIQEGFIGLLDAIRNFDESRGIPFLAYARKRVIGSIRDCIRENTTSPRSIAKFWKERQKTVEAFYDKHSRLPSQAETADLMGLKHDHYHRLDVVSLEIYEGTSLELSQSLEYDVEWRVDKEEKMQVTKLALLSLKARQIEILHLSYVRGMTMVEIGLKIGVNESRVSQLRTRALNEIRRVLSRLGY
jgi:RNA polymerase sigma factor FliA